MCVSVMSATVDNNHSKHDKFHNTIKNNYQFRGEEKQSRRCHESSSSQFEISTCMLKIVNMISSISINNLSTNSKSWILKIIILFYSLTPILSQECACSPSVLTFKLDFNATCPPENVVTGPDTGIDAIFCQVAVEPMQGYSTASREDLTPVTVTQISVFELDNQLSVIKQSFLSNVRLENGDYYTYSSIIGDYNPDEPSATEIPGGLQVLLKGENSKGISISNSFILTYTNRCDVVPFTTEDSIGWNDIVGIDPPPYQLCPIYSPPDTIAPTNSPTLPLTLPPTLSPALPPSTLIPITVSPTPAPTPGIIPATSVPTPSPTTAPIMTTSEPTDVLDTEKPTHAPSDGIMSMDYNWLFYEIDFNHKRRKRRLKKNLRKR